MSRSKTFRFSILQSWRRKWGAFRRRLRRALPAILFVALLTGWIAVLEWFGGLSTPKLDTALHFGRSPRSTTIVQVVIDDESLDDNEPPIDPAKVRRLLQEIARGGAAVIGVDIETESEEYRGLLDDLKLPPTVWVVPYSEKGRPVSVLGREVVFDGGQFRLEGGEAGRDVRVGLGAFVQDRDGIVRRYHRSIPVGDVEVPSLPAEIVRAWDELEGHPPRDPGEEFLILFEDDPSHFTSNPASWFLDAERQEWAQNRPLAGKIVLLGGTFEKARDVIETSLGERPGVEVIAYAVEADIEDRGVRLRGKWAVLACSVLAPVSVVALFFLLPPRRALVWGALLAIVLAPLFSWICFSRLAYWVQFAPPLAAVWVSQLYKTLRKSALKKASDSVATAGAQMAGHLDE